MLSTAAVDSYDWGGRVHADARSWHRPTCQSEPSRTDTRQMHLQCPAAAQLAVLLQQLRFLCLPHVPSQEDLNSLYVPPCIAKYLR